MCFFSCYLALSLEKYLQYSIGIATEQSFRYIELTDAKIWITKNVSLCWVLANRVTYVTRFAKTQHNDAFLVIQIFASVSSIYLKLCSVAIPMLYCKYFSSDKAR